MYPQPFFDPLQESRVAYGSLPLLLHYDALSKGILPVEKSYRVSATRHSKMNVFPSFSDDNEWDEFMLEIAAQRASKLA